MAALIDTYAEPSASLLARFDGCCRYVSHETSKSIDSGQVQRIHAQKKSIVLNFEDSATRAQGGSSAGAADGQFFVGVAHSIRTPAGVAGYASVDYEVHSGSPLLVVESYFRGWTPVLHNAGYLSGAYGDADLITALLASGLIDLGWQTAAWSYGNRVRDSRAALLQDQFNPSYDVDEITAAFYGGWLPSGAQPHPGTTPSSSEDDDMAKPIVAHDGTGQWWWIAADGGHKTPITQQLATGLLKTGDYRGNPGITEGDLAHIPTAK